MAFDLTAPPPDFDAAVAGISRAAKDVGANVDVPKIRMESLREAALGYGVRSGLARRTYEITRVVNENGDLLDGVFDFNALMLERSVMPAVLSEVTNTVKLTDADTLRVADATYRIERQVTFVTVAPTWRDYLIRDFGTSKAALPAEILLPRDDSERKVWQSYVVQGWGTGVRQANSIFEASVARLQRDYKGMILYRVLQTRGMIGKPYVGVANLGVTGDGNSMTVNDRLLRITAKPQLQTDPKAWKPLATPPGVK